MAKPDPGRKNGSKGLGPKAGGVEKPKHVGPGPKAKPSSNGAGAAKGTTGAKVGGVKVYRPQNGTAAAGSPAVKKGPKVSKPQNAASGQDGKAKPAKSGAEPSALSGPKVGSKRPRSKGEAAIAADGDQAGGNKAAVAAVAAVTVTGAAAVGKGKVAVSSNWEAMKAIIGATGQGRKHKAADSKEDRKASKKAAGNDAEEAPPKTLESKGSNASVTKVVAMDCEMVGVGHGGKRSVIARVCIVNDYGNVLLDAYVKPKETVTDYRTWVSGIEPHHLRGEDALTLEEAQEKVAKILKGAILVGHALHNDLKAMLLDHPHKDTRDTARYPAFMRSPAPGRKPKPRALRKLAAEELGITIQEGAHTPVDDARAALYIYHKHRKEWEHGIKTGSLQKSIAESAAQRKELREAMAARAGSGSAARRARRGVGKGQMRLASELGLEKDKAEGRVDPYNRDVRDDPYADL